MSSMLNTLSTEDSDKDHDSHEDHEACWCVQCFQWFDGTLPASHPFMSSINWFHRAVCRCGSMTTCTSGSLDSPREIGGVQKDWISGLFQSLCPSCLKIVCCEVLLTIWLVMWFDVFFLIVGDVSSSTGARLAHVVLFTSETFQNVQHIYCLSACVFVFTLSC